MPLPSTLETNDTVSRGTTQIHAKCAFWDSIKSSADNAASACRPTYRAANSGAIDTSPFDYRISATAALCKSILEILSVLVCALILSYYTNFVKGFR